MAAASYYQNLKNFVSGYYMFIILAIVWGIFAVISPGFLTASNIYRIILFSTPLLIVSLAQNVVILTKGFDLTVGSLVSLTTVIVSVMMDWKWPLMVIIAIALIVGLIVGTFNGFCISRFKVDPFIITLSASFMLDGIALMIRPTPGGNIYPEFISGIMLYVSGFPVGPLLIFILVGIIGTLFLERRSIGRLIYAVGCTEERALLRGINVRRILLLVYILSGLLVSIGGLVYTAYIQIGDPNLGAPLLFASITAVFLGGTSAAGGIGRFPNTCAAVLLISSITTFLFQIQVIAWYRYIINGVLLIGSAIFSKYVIEVRVRTGGI
jgi:ribose/xylose/arabinose/galactoside ABC-type transport system permease subunit